MEFPIISFRELQNTDIYEPDMQRYIREVIQLLDPSAIKRLDDLDKRMAALEEWEDEEWKKLNREYLDFLKTYFK